MSSFLMFRIGSPEYIRMAAFRDCVNANRDRKLFEVVDCGDPFEDGGAAAGRPGRRYR